MRKIHIKTFLFGNNRQTAKTALVLGILFGIGALIGAPIIIKYYSLVPRSPTEFGIFLMFTLVAAGIVYEGGGVLSASWINFPASVSIITSYYSHHGFVIIPEPEILYYLLIAAVLSLVYAILGYPLGLGARYIFRRTESEGD